MRLDEKLSEEAEHLSANIILQKSYLYTPPPGMENYEVLSFVTESPHVLSKTFAEKIAHNMIPSHKMGIGIIFGKNKEFPRGAYWVSILFEE